MGFQDPATTIIANLANLYDLALTICVLVVTFVALGLGGLLYRRGLRGRCILNADRLEIA